VSRGRHEVAEAAAGRNGGGGASKKSLGWKGAGWPTDLGLGFRPATGAREEGSMGGVRWRAGRRRTGGGCASGRVGRRGGAAALLAAGGGTDGSADGGG
jgi:hypothetical protein